MRIRRRLGTGLAAGGMALLTMAVTTAPASAYVAAPDLDAAVYTARGNLGQTLIQNNFFWVTDVDGDGSNRADGTPDGQGAFQWFVGNNGAGAVYSFRGGGGITSGAIYGQILQSWSANGYESGKGYPWGNEGSATSPCPFGTLRMQVFRRLSDGAPRRACWGPTVAFRDQYNVRWLNY